MSKRSRREPHAVLNFFSFNIKGFQFPFVLLFFHLLMGQSIWGDLLGLGSGHIYYFLKDVVPQEYTSFKKSLRYGHEWIQTTIFHGFGHFSRDHGSRYSIVYQMDNFLIQTLWEHISWVWPPFRIRDDKNQRNLEQILKQWAPMQAKLVLNNQKESQHCRNKALETLWTETRKLKINYVILGRPGAPKWSPNHKCNILEPLCSVQNNVFSQMLFSLVFEPPLK